MKKETEAFKDKHYSKLHSLHWRNYQIFTLPPLELAYFEFIWHKTEFWYNNKNENKFYWTNETAIKEFRVKRTVLERLSKDFTNLCIIIKTTEKIKIGSQVTRVQFYSLNFHSLTNPVILSKIIKPEFITEMQSEFSHLANVMGYIDKPVVKYVEPLQEVKDFYNQQYQSKITERLNDEYYNFAAYLLTDKNPFKRPLTEITSLPGQPTYDEFVKIRELALTKGVDLYLVLNKYIDYPKKTKSFTVSFHKWIQSEKQTSKFNPNAVFTGACDLIDEIGFEAKKQGKTAYEFLHGK